MATLSNVVCLVMHRNVIHRFVVQALQNPPLCSSTLLTASWNEGLLSVDPASTPSKWDHWGSEASTPPTLSPA